MRLVRLQKRSDGVFSRLYNDHGVPIAFTLEHAYPAIDSDSWVAKIPNGTFTCVRGIHCLHNGVPFPTFEITGVAGHKNLLFHAGNFDKDSEGCCLIGRDIVTQADGSEMVTDSKRTFGEFMSNLHDINEFSLVVMEEEKTK